MNKEPRSPTSTRTKVLLLVVAGWLTYVVADKAERSTNRMSLGDWAANAVTAVTEDAVAAAATQDATPTVSAPALQPIAEPRGTKAGTIAYSQNPAQPAAPAVYVGPLIVPSESSPSSARKSRMAQSSITTEAPRIVEPPENVIPLLGPEPRESGWRAVVAPPFLTCTVEITEHGALVSHQTVGCTQSGEGERPFMLLEFGQEVPNEIPNMKYWLSMQVEGYRKGYPVVRTRMELKGLLGRAAGRRKYESMTIVEPNRKHTVIAFNIDDDDFAVTIVAKKQD